MWAQKRLVALLSWDPALFGPIDWRRGWWRSLHHTEFETSERGLGVQVWTGTWTPGQEGDGLVLHVPRVQAGCVFSGYPTGGIDS